jgi:hypothetical protein
MYVVYVRTLYVCMYVGARYAVQRRPPGGRCHAAAATRSTNPTAQTLPTIYCTVPPSLYRCALSKRIPCSRPAGHWRALDRLSKGDAGTTRGARRQGRIRWVRRRNAPLRLDDELAWPDRVERARLVSTHRVLSSAILYAVHRWLNNRIMKNNNDASALPNCAS